MTKTDTLLIKEVSILALPIALAAILDFLLSKDTLLVIWVIAIEFGAPANSAVAEVGLNTARPTFRLNP